MTSPLGLSFFLPGQQVRHQALTGGNVNDSWLVTTGSGDQWVLQRLRRSIFAEPQLVMANIETVTTLLSAADAGPEVRFPVLAKNPDGKTFCIDEAGDCWRMLSYLDKTRTLHRLTDVDQACRLGRLLAFFHLQVQCLASEQFHDPLPDFHITPVYLARYDRVSKTLPPADEATGRCQSFIDTHRAKAALLEDHRPRLAQQVIHGDPKVANFLFSIDNDLPVSLIDLDTVKPGLLLHDLGDALRSCCNPAGEDTPNPDQVTFDPNLFQAFLTGYVAIAGHLLTSEDRRLLVDAVWLISFELGLRFLTDHYEGDRYFRTTQPGHNLHRARIQFSLAGSIESQRDMLNAVVDRLPLPAL